MGVRDSIKEKTTLAGFIGKALARTVQFALAVAVVGLYGYRLSADRANGSVTPHKWLYAEVVAAMSAITAIIYMFPCVKTHILFIWDLILFILWTVTFGIFAVIYLHRADNNPYEGTDTRRMKSAMWLDLANMVLWFVTGLYGGLMFLRARKQSAQPASKSVV